MTWLEFGLFLLHDTWKQWETIAAARVLVPGIYIMDIDVTEKVTNKSFWKEESYQEADMIDDDKIDDAEKENMVDDDQIDDDEKEIERSEKWHTVDKKLEETKSKYYDKWRDKILSKNKEIEKKLLPGSTKPRQTEIVRFSVPHRSETSHVI